MMIRVVSCYMLCITIHVTVQRGHVASQFNTDKKCVNLLSPNIHIQILQTDLYSFPSRISWENLMKDQGIFSQVIILLILIT